MAETKKSKSKGFQSMGLSDEIFKGIMQMGYKIPTPVQRKSLPVTLTSVDTVVMARTGSGKTAAFLIPVLEKLKQHSTKIGARAVILSPSRELALQTLTFAKKMSRFTNFKFALIVGGESMDKQFESLSKNPDILIATPGRLVHLLQEVSTFSLNCIEVVVFDEADRLFEMGFAEQLREIMRTIPEQRQSLLFSATMPSQLVQFARAGLHDPVLIRLDVEHRVSESLKMTFLTCRSTDKPACLLFLLRQVIPLDQMTVIFTATRHHAEYLNALVKQTGLESSIIYGAMDQENRKLNLENFRRGKVKLLLVTDVAARGIDVPLLNNVINYNFPPLPKLFVHRVGRAARQGRIGAAFSLVEPEELPYMIDLHLFLGRPIADTQSKEYVTGYQLDSMTPDMVHYGGFPQQILDEENESLHELTERGGPAAGLKHLAKVAGNAMKQYRRTRPDPSKRAIERAKLLDRAVVHPLLSKYAMHGMVHKENASNRESFLKAMSEFRPKETIFEVIGANGTDRVMENVRHEVRVKNLLNHSSNTVTDQADIVETTEDPYNSNNVVKSLITVYEKSENVENISFEKKDSAKLSKTVRKRLKKAKSNGADSAVIQSMIESGRKSSIQSKEDKKKSNEKFQTGLFADPEHYMSYGITEADAFIEGAMQPRSVEKAGDGFVTDRLADAMLDVNPDEAVDLVRKQRVLHWDQKKRKFVKTSLAEMGENKKRTVRNEAGVVVSLKKEKTGEIFQRWQKKTRSVMGREGDEEEENTHRGPTNGGPNLGHGINSSAKNELKSVGQIRKMREKDTLKKIKNLPKDKRTAIMNKRKATNKKKNEEKRKSKFHKNTRSRAIIRV